MRHFIPRYDGERGVRVNVNLSSPFSLAGNPVRIIHNHASMLCERECEDMALRISERSHSYSYHM